MYALGLIKLHSSSKSSPTESVSHIRNNAKYGIKKFEDSKLMLQTKTKRATRKSSTVYNIQVCIHQRQTCESDWQAPTAMTCTRIFQFSFCHFTCMLYKSIYLFLAKGRQVLCASMLALTQSHLVLIYQYHQGKLLEQSPWDATSCES